jgi:hypothetical protein
MDKVIYSQKPEDSWLKFNQLLVLFRRVNNGAYPTKLICGEEAYQALENTKCSDSKIKNSLEYIKGVFETKYSLDVEKTDIDPFYMWVY